MKDRIWLSAPHMSGNELSFVKESFDTNWVAPIGPNIDHFESDISKYLDVKCAAVLSSGTAAIHLSLKLLDVKRGDYVICQSMTFAASANPIIYCDAIPVFIDSEKDTWNMDPELLLDAILHCIKSGKKPKAIIVVHLYGMPAKMGKILEYATRYEIPVIEDAAEALGSEFMNKKCGTFGEFGILSFNGNKIITTSGGGALVSNSCNLIERAKYFATQARDIAPHYQHSEIGYNYRMSNICAGIGRAQMQVLNLRVEQRRAVYSYYKEHLSSIPAILFQEESNSSKSNRWLTTILIYDGNKSDTLREKVRLNLAEVNIESRPLWKPMHLQPVFRNSISFLNGVSEELFNVGLCLPSSSNLKPDDLARVVEIVRNTLCC